MATTPILSNFIPLLNPREVSFENIRNWNLTQANALSKTVQIIESDIKTIQLYNPTIKKGNIDWSRQLNKHTSKYLTKKNKPNKGERNEIKKLTDELGLLVPVSDIANTKHKELSDSMNVLAQITADFKYIDLLDTVAENINSDSQKKLPLSTVTLLYTAEKYINIVLFSDSMTASITNLEGWISHYSPIANDKQLNTQVFFSWFYELVDKVVISNNPLIVEDGYDYDKDVLVLISKYKKVFIEELLEVKKSNSKYFFFSSFPDFNDDLHNLLSIDYRLLMLDRYIIMHREITVDGRNENIHLVHKALDEESIISQIGKTFSRKNIVNTVKSMLTYKANFNDLSLFGNKQLDYGDLLLRKSRLTNNEINLLIDIGQSSMNPQNDEYVYSVNQQIEEYQLELCNTISLPFYKWERVEQKLVPNLNLATITESDIATTYLKHKKDHEKAEAELLVSYIESIQNVRSNEGLQRIIDSVPSFFYASNQRRWNIAIRQANETMRSRSAFREQKMRELGIDLEEGFSIAQKEVFLTEMLQIEEEIQSFVPFVTSAFKTALPSKRTTEFDSFRHTSDGIEFDPETVFDPEKWIRGNVMKTLKTKIKKGEVTQVNCFCLDLSGSMDHDRMRNLYKMLYLMVTGLQSRKSFDAFHFFSNNFIPGVEFDYEYTRKNLLFKILTVISRISGPHITYTGLESTNISDGIIGCEDRMIDFVNRLKSKNSEINLSCSMFVITDGEPSMGIRNLKELNKFVNKRREVTGFAIKGIYIKSEDDKKTFITKIFGEEHSTETSNFEEGVQKLTNMMTKTYLQQRQEHKWEKRRKRISSHGERSE